MFQCQTLEYAAGFDVDDDAVLAVLRLLDTCIQAQGHDTPQVSQLPLTLADIMERCSRDSVLVAACQALSELHLARSEPTHQLATAVCCAQQQPGVL
jgi:hypothetical protein